MSQRTAGTGRATRTRRAPGSQAAALEVTLEALAAAGRLERVDEALVGVCRGLAATIDVTPGVAALWKEYREALVLLRSAGDDRDTDAFGDLLADLRASVGDSPSS